MQNFTINKSDLFYTIKTLLESNDGEKSVSDLLDHTVADEYTFDSFSKCTYTTESNAYVIQLLHVIDKTIIDQGIKRYNTYEGDIVIAAKQFFTTTYTTLIKQSDSLRELLNIRPQIVSNYVDNLVSNPTTDESVYVTIDTINTIGNELDEQEYNGETTLIDAINELLASNSSLIVLNHVNTNTNTIESAYNTLSGHLKPYVTLAGYDNIFKNVFCKLRGINPDDVFSSTNYDQTIRECNDIVDDIVTRITRDGNNSDKLNPYDVQTIISNIPAYNVDRDGTVIQTIESSLIKEAMNITLANNNSYADITESSITNSAVIDDAIKPLVSQFAIALLPIALNVTQDGKPWGSSQQESFTNQLNRLLPPLINAINTNLGSLQSDPDFVTYCLTKFSTFNGSFKLEKISDYISDFSRTYFAETHTLETLLNQIGSGTEPLMANLAKAILTRLQTTGSSQLSTSFTSNEKYNTHLNKFITMYQSITDAVNKYNAANPSYPLTQDDVVQALCNELTSQTPANELLGLLDSVSKFSASNFNSLVQFTQQQKHGAKIAHDNTLEAIYDSCNTGNPVTAKVINLLKSVNSAMLDTDCSSNKAAIVKFVSEFGLNVQTAVTNLNQKYATKKYYQNHQLTVDQVLDSLESYISSQSAATQPLVSMLMVHPRNFNFNMLVNTVYNDLYLSDIQNEQLAASHGATPPSASSVNPSSPTKTVNIANVLNKSNPQVQQEPEEDDSDFSFNTIDRLTGYKDFRTTYPTIYQAIDQASYGDQQIAENAKSYVDEIIASRDEPLASQLMNYRGGNQIFVRSIVNQANGVSSEPSRNSVEPTASEPSYNGVFNVPEGFNGDNDTELWKSPVITAFGFPYINYEHGLVTALKSANPDVSKAAYANFKTLLRKCKDDSNGVYSSVWNTLAASPLDTLKAFTTKPAKKLYLNTLMVDSDTLRDAALTDIIQATPISVTTPAAEFKNGVPLTKMFLTQFYKVLRVLPESTMAKNLYCKYAGIDVDEWNDAIASNNGNPPIYILVPKTASFGVIEEKTSLLGKLFKSLTGKTDLAFIKSSCFGTHGGFVMPKNDANNLFNEFGRI